MAMHVVILILKRRRFANRRFKSACSGRSYRNYEAPGIVPVQDRFGAVAPFVPCDQLIADVGADPESLRQFRSQCGCSAKGDQRVDPLGRGGVLCTSWDRGIPEWLADVGR